MAKLYLVLFLLIGRNLGLLPLAKVCELWLGLDGSTELVRIWAPVRRLGRALDVLSRTMVCCPLCVLC